MMNIKILLPYRLFFESSGIRRVVIEGPQGFMGILPHRLDCVTPLVPSIMTVELESGEEKHFAVDEGVFTKFGDEAYVSVRNAVAGENLQDLRQAVKVDFAKRIADEEQLKQVLAKLESGFVGRLRSLHRE